MHAGTCVDRPVKSISSRSTFLSRSVVSVFFVVKPSHRSSLLSPKLKLFFTKGQIFKKFACFSGLVEALPSCRWRRLSTSTGYYRFVNAAVRKWIGQRPFFHPPFWKRMKLGRRSRRSSFRRESKCRVSDAAGASGEERERERERERDRRTDRQKEERDRQINQQTDRKRGHPEKCVWGGGGRIKEN